VRLIDRQSFPTDLTLSRNLDCQLLGFDFARLPPSCCAEGEPALGESKHSEVQNSLAKSRVPAPVIAYVLTTIKWDSQSHCFQQTGSAPNFQGGLVSLCTCRANIRTWRENWRHVWIAGFADKETTEQYREHHPSNLSTGVDINRLRVLFYLMQIDFCEKNHSDLSNSPAYLHARGQKDASVHKFGDLYKPKTGGTNLAYCPDSYELPVHPPAPNTAKHVHYPDAWRIDISGTHDGKHPALLVGDPSRSFIWTGTKHGYLSHQVYRHKIFPTLRDFYSALI
jgi:hypothetical protein